MLAAIDAGSNTLRLLLGRVARGRVLPEQYQRRITRLAGGFTHEEGLSPVAMERTLLAFGDFSSICRAADVKQIAAVGTAAFRLAVNGPSFAAEIQRRFGIPLEIISGEREAELMAAGVLSALDAPDQPSLIVDIGGGSTELVLVSCGEVLWSCSLPLGVVRLSEDYPTGENRRKAILDRLSSVRPMIGDACRQAHLVPKDLVLVGTAGTVTTLAALDMQMSDYDWRKVNGYRMRRAGVERWLQQLGPMTASERESLAGMEAGRGDLIVAGIEILCGVMGLVGTAELVVSDFGILEGLLLSLPGSSGGTTTG